MLPKNDKICILGLELANSLPKVQLGITSVKSDSFVYHSASFEPRIEILLFLIFSEAGLLKTVQNYMSRCHGSREIGKTKVHQNV